MPDDALATAGMTISLRIRRDLVIVDPGRFFAAARDAYRAAHPGATDAEVAEQVADVSDAIHALIDRQPATISLWPDPERPEAGRGAPLPGARDRSAGWALACRFDRAGRADGAAAVAGLRVRAARGSVRH